MSVIISDTGYTFPDGTIKTSANKTVTGDFINEQLQYGLTQWLGYGQSVLTADRKGIIAWKSNQGQGHTTFGHEFQGGTPGVIRPEIISFPLTETGTIIQASISANHAFALFSTGNLYEWGFCAEQPYYGDSGGYPYYIGWFTVVPSEDLNIDYTSGWDTYIVRGISPALTQTGVVRVYPQQNAGPYSSLPNGTLVIKKTDGKFYGKGENVNGGLGAMGGQRMPQEAATYHGVANTSNPASYGSDAGKFFYWKELTSIAAFSVADDRFFNISSGNGFSSLVWQTTDGNIYMCGDNSYGRLGNGNSTHQTSPVNVTASWGGTGGGDLVYVSGGGWWYGHGAPWQWNGNNILMLRRTNSTTETIWSNGYNGYGELGDGTATSRSVPFSRVLGTNGVDPVGELTVLGAPGSCYYIRAGKMWRWGYNGLGQLGNGTTTSVYTPDIINTAPSGLPWSKMLVRTWGSTYDYGHYITVFVSDTAGNVFSAGYNNVNQRCASGIAVTNNFTECPQLVGCKQVTVSGQSGGFSYVGIIPGYDRGNGVWSKTRVVQWGHANWNEVWTGPGMTGTNPSSPICVVAFGV